MSLSSLDRIIHPAEAPPALCLEKWQRVERRVASMILQSAPSQVRDELAASRRLSTFGILTYLLVTYSPGGVSEKQFAAQPRRSSRDPECLGRPNCLETVAPVEDKNERDWCNCP